MFDLASSLHLSLTCLSYDPSASSFSAASASAISRCLRPKSSKVLASTRPAPSELIISFSFWFSSSTNDFSVHTIRPGLQLSHQLLLSMNHVAPFSCEHSRLLSGYITGHGISGPACGFSFTTALFLILKCPRLHGTKARTWTKGQIAADRLK